MITKKNYDAVKEMREIREKLSLRYWKKPEILMKDMATIQKKYQFTEINKTLPLITPNSKK